MPKKLYQRDVAIEDEADILERWINHLRRRNKEVGHWQPIRGIVYKHFLKEFRNKAHGMLVKTTEDRTWNLYFYHDPESFNVETLISRIEEHPLYADGEEVGKILTSWDRKKERWQHHDHLSAANYGFRSRRNFSVTAGYSMHKDGVTDRRLT